jgi:Protein of unknown function (DUF3108)
VKNLASGLTVKHLPPTEYRHSALSRIMLRMSLPGGWRRFCVAGSALMAACFCGDGATAQGKLDARYTVTLGGVPIGRGAWVIDIGEEQFTAAASGVATGLMTVFTNGQGSGASRGTVRGDSLAPTVFASSISHDRRVDELRMVMSGGTIKELFVEPPVLPNPERVPVTEASKRGVTDPMSAALIHVAGTADPVSAEACRRTLAVFDGRMRFDLHLSFKRFERVQSERGYQGQVAVCGVQFVPVAGYVPSRFVVKYLMAQRDMEIWLAPIMGTRIVVPYRISLQTPLGTGVLAATTFVTAPVPRSTAAAAR